MWFEWCLGGFSQLNCCLWRDLESPALFISKSKRPAVCSWLTAMVTWHRQTLTWCIVWFLRCVNWERALRQVTVLVATAEQTWRSRVPGGTPSHPAPAAVHARPLCVPGREAAGGPGRWQPLAEFGRTPPAPAAEGTWHEAGPWHLTPLCTLKRKHFTPWRGTLCHSKGRTWKRLLSASGRAQRGWAFLERDQNIPENQRTRLCSYPPAPTYCTTRSWWPPWRQVACQILTDPFLPCGPIVAQYLSVPAVFFEWTAMWPGLSGYPEPQSTIPMCPGICPLTQITWPSCSGWRTCSSPCQEVSSRCGLFPVQALASGNSFRKTWLFRISWALGLFGFSEMTCVQFPRPIMPNIVFVGGINCASKKPLSQVCIWVGTLYTCILARTLSEWACHGSAETASNAFLLFISICPVS